jgi:hypothetical protein
LLFGRVVLSDLRESKLDKGISQMAKKPGKFPYTVGIPMTRQLHAAMREAADLEFQSLCSWARRALIKGLKESGVKVPVEKQPIPPKRQAERYRLTHQQADAQISSAA